MSDHVFVVGIKALNEKEREQLIDVLREKIMDYDFVTDVLDYDGREDGQTTTSGA